MPSGIGPELLLAAGLMAIIAIAYFVGRTRRQPRAPHAPPARPEPARKPEPVTEIDRATRPGQPPARPKTVHLALADSVLTRSVTTYIWIVAAHDRVVAGTPLDEVTSGATGQEIGSPSTQQCVRSPFTECSVSEVTRTGSG